MLVLFIFLGWGGAVVSYLLLHGFPCFLCMTAGVLLGFFSTFAFINAKNDANARRNALEKLLNDLGIVLTAFWDLVLVTNQYEKYYGNEYVVTEEILNIMHTAAGNIQRLVSLFGAPQIYPQGTQSVVPRNVAGDLVEQYHRLYKPVIEKVYEFNNAFLALKDLQANLYYKPIYSTYGFRYINADYFEEALLRIHARKFNAHAEVMRRTAKLVKELRICKRRQRLHS